MEQVTKTLLCDRITKYRKTSNKIRAKSINLNVSGLASWLSSANPVKPGAKSIMKMYLEQCRQAMLQLHLSDQQFYYLLLTKVWLILEVLR